MVAFEKSDFNLSWGVRTGTLLGEIEIPSPEGMMDLLAFGGTGGPTNVV